MNTLLLADLDTLRHLPNVTKVSSVSTLPLLGGTSNTYLNRLPAHPRGEAFAGLYYSDDATLDALGLHLIAGRNFNRSDLNRQGDAQPITILSRALAGKMFPAEDALGKTIYMDGGQSPSDGIGIVDALCVSSVAADEASVASFSVLLPQRVDGSMGRRQPMRSAPRTAICRKYFAPCRRHFIAATRCGSWTRKARCPIRQFAHRPSVVTMDRSC